MSAREAAGPRRPARWLLIAAAVVLCGTQVRLADAQMMPGGGGMGGGGMGGRGQMPPGAGGMPDEAPSDSSSQKPDVAVKKAMKAATKALDKAKALEADAAATTNPDKKAKDMDRVSDQYNIALDAFTEALSNKSDIVVAWDQVGYIHLRLAAYREAIDDYNHTLTLKPELMEAIEHRAEAYLAVDHLEDVRIAYMDLYSHTPDLAAQLMAAMQKWLAEHQADSHGLRSSEIDSFAKWVSERDGIAKQTASLPH
jgi:tetratricopeptide (TPR) repeat protein